MGSQVLYILAALLAFSAILLQIRSGRLREKYATFWIIFAFALLCVTGFPEFFSQIGLLVGIKYLSNFIFLLAFAAIFSVLVQISIEVSRVENQIQTLAEEITFLQSKLESENFKKNKTEDFS